MKTIAHTTPIAQRRALCVINAALILTSWGAQCPSHAEPKPVVIPTTSSASAPSSAASSPFSFEIIKERLPNGLTLIMNPDHRVPTVAVEVRYLVGSAHERPGRSGFAHLFEHLMFQGSKSYDQEYFTPFTPIGGRVNGTTNTDRTNYYEQVPAEALELALWMESDRMEGLLEALTQEKLDNQRDVVKNERRQRYENTPYGMVWKVLANDLYPEGHPYQHTTIGSHADLTAATLDDVKSFFKRYYVPANAVVTLAGDFKPAEARALVYRYFGHLPSGERAPTPQVTPIPELGERSVTLTDQVKLPRVYLAWHTPGLYKRGDSEMDLLASLLSDGKSSALYKPLVFERQLAKDVFAYQMSRGLGSVFVVGATAAPGKDLDELTRALREELSAALKRPIEPDQFKRALNGWRKSFYSRIESPLSRAQQLSNYEHLLGRPDAFALDLKRYTDLTPSRVAEAAQRWISASPLTIRVVPAHATNAKPDRSAPPKLAERKLWIPPSVETFTTAQGLEVWLSTQKQSPLVSLKMIFNRGASSDPADRAGLTSLMVKLLDEGAGDRDAIEVSDALQRLATDYGASVNQDHITLSMDMLSEEIGGSLDLLADFTRRPRFADADIDRVRKQSLASVINRAADPRSVRSLVLKRALFGSGYAGLPADGFAETLNAIKREELVAAHRARIQPQGTAVIVVGDITRERLERELNRAFAGWEGAPTAQDRPVTLTETPAAIHWVDFPGSTQSALAAVRATAPLKGARAELSAELFNLVFGGKFTSRLNLNLREDKGYTYGAYSGLYQLRSTQFHFLGAMVKGDQTFASTQEMLRELREVSSSRPAAASELETMRRGEVSGYPAKLGDRSHLVSELAQLYRDGKPVSWLSEWLKRLGEVTLDEVNGAAKSIASAEQYHIIIAGDFKAHAEDFKALKLPIKLYSAEGELKR